MLHKISKLFVFGLAVVIVSGCMKVKKKGEEEVAASPEVSVEVQSTQVQGFDFDYELDEGMQKVRFKIPNSWPESVVVEKTVGNKKANLREIVFPQQIWKDQLDLDSKTSYKFYEKLANEMKLIEQIDVIPVLDFDLKQDLNLTELFGSLSLVKKIQIRNFEIRNSARFFIGDYKGLIEIENLQSDKGIIQTFAEDARSAQGHGRSVGEFRLKILNGVGELNVHLFAEAGANGASGKQPDAALAGAAGSLGQNAQFTVVGMTSCTGLGSDMCFPSAIYKCSKPPGKGGDSQDGLQGYPGASGFQGGSVKNVQLENLSSSLQVHVYKKAGRKGLGGAGGLGGRPGSPGQGGDGGIRGFMLSLNIDPDDPQAMGKLFGRVLGESCPQGEAGKSGVQGPQGLSGPDGEDGIVF